MGIRKHFEKKGEEDLRLQDMSLEQEETKPEFKFDPETEITESDWQGMKQQLEQFQKDKDWRGLTLQAMPMKILAPDKSAQLNIDDPTWQGMKQLLEAHQNNNWWDFAYQAVPMKILAPDKSSELNIDNQAWQGMKQELEQDRNGKWWRFTDLAMAMKILAADKAEITDQGLEITMLPPESFKSEKKPRPERRSF